MCCGYLLEGLLILSVLEGVYERVDGGGHPGEHRGDHVQGGDTELIINHIDQHQGQEADKERDEDGQHHLENRSSLNLNFFNNTLLCRLSLNFNTNSKQDEVF